MLMVAFVNVLDSYSEAKAAVPAVVPATFYSTLLG